MHIRLLSHDLKEKEVGHKAYQLSRVFKTFNVPPGFILTTQHFLYFMSTIRQKVDGLLNNLPMHDEEKFQNIANEIQKTIVETQFPGDLKNQIIEFYHSLNISQDNSSGSGSGVHHMINQDGDPLVAVRSSAFVTNENFNFTSLNVRSVDSLLQSIKIAWASLYTKK